MLVIYRHPSLFSVTSATSYPPSSAGISLEEEKQKHNYAYALNTDTKHTWNGVV